MSLYYLDTGDEGIPPSGWYSDVLRTSNNGWRRFDSKEAGVAAESAATGAPVKVIEPPKPKEQNPSDLFLNASLVDAPLEGLKRWGVSDPKNLAVKWVTQETGPDALQFYDKTTGKDVGLLGGSLGQGPGLGVDRNGNIVGVTYPDQGGFWSNLTSGVKDLVTSPAGAMVLAPITGGALGATAATAATAVQAANAIDQGNVLGGLAMLAGVPGVSEAAKAADLGAVVNAVQTANQVAKLENAIESGNVLGAISSGVGLTDTGGTQLGDTGYTVSDAIKAANIASAVEQGNVVPLITSIAKQGNAAQKPVESYTTQTSAELPDEFATDEAAEPEPEVPVATYGDEPDASSVQADAGGLPSGTQIAASNYDGEHAGFVYDPNYVDSDGNTGAYRPIETATDAGSGGLPSTNVDSKTQSTLDSLKNINAETAAANTAPDWVQTAAGEKVVGSNIGSDGALSYTIERTNPNDPTQKMTYDVRKDPSTGEITYESGGLTDGNMQVVSSRTPPASEWDAAEPTVQGGQTGQTGAGSTATNTDDQINSPLGQTQSPTGVTPQGSVPTGGLPAGQTGQTTSTDTQTTNTGTQGSAPNTGTGSTQQTQNTPTGGLPSGVTASDVRNIVNDALRNNPSLTASQVQNIVNDSLRNNPSLTASDVQQIVNTSLQNQPSLSSADVQGIVDTALRNNPSLKPEDVQSIVNDALRNNPSLSPEDVRSIVNEGTSELRGGLSSLGDTVASNQAASEKANAEFSAKLEASDAATRAGFERLNFAQQEAVKQAAEQGQSLRDAIDATAAKSAADMQSGLSALSSDFQAKLAESDAATQAGFASLTDAQKAEAAARVQQGQDLQSAISNVESGLGSKIESGLSGLASDFSSQLAASNEATRAGLDQLTAAQRAEVQARVDMGQSLQDAINASQASTSAQISGVQSSLEGQLGAQGKQLMDALRQQGVDYNTALQEAINAQNSNFANYQSATESALGGLGQKIGDVAAQSQQGIAGVQSGLDALSSDFQTKFANLDSSTQARFDAMSDDQKALAASLAATSGDLNNAINSVAESTATQIGNLSDTVSQNQQATNTAIGNLTSNVNSQIGGVNTNLNAVKTQVADQAAANAMQNASKWLDTTPQMIKAASTQQNPAQLAQLKQLYGSLTPELRSVLAERGVPEPQDHGAAPAFEDGFASGGSASSLQSVLESMSPKFSKSSGVLEAAPVTQQQSRLNALKHLYDGLKSRQGTSSLARGGLPSKYHEAAPEGHNPEFVTGLTGYYASGRGTGQSDDIPAMLHDGDYVIDADAVAALGDGSSKAGAQALAKLQSQIPHRDGGPVSGRPVPARIADGEYVFPAAFVSALGGGDNKRGSQMLDSMREALRAHKRSAPTSKIPPKAKSPLDYLRMVKG